MPFSGFLCCAKWFYCVAKHWQEQPKRIQIKKQMDSWYLGKGGEKRGSKSNILISKLLEQFCFWCSWQLSVSPKQQREALFQKRKAKGCAHYCAAAFLGKKQQTTNFFIKVVHNLGLSLDGSNF